MSQPHASQQSDRTSLDDFGATGLSRRASGLHAVPADVRTAKGPIRRRRIIYIAGYDPRGPEEAARRILAREIGRMSNRTGIIAEITPVVTEAGTYEATWSVTSQNCKDTSVAWSVSNDFLFLRWDDLVAPDFARPYPARLVRSLGVLLDYLLTGTLIRMARTSHTTLFLWLYPPIAALLLMLVAGLAGTVAQWAAHSVFAITQPLNGLIGITVAILIALSGAAAMRFRYWGHLMELWIFCRDYAVGNRPDVEERCRTFARIIAEAAAKKDVDETIVLGHSCGGMLTLEAMGEALLTTPEAFKTGAPVVLCNIGSCAGTSLLRHTSEMTRSRILALAETKNLVWLEIQAKQDLINYYQADPVNMAGIDRDCSRANPAIRIVNIKDLIAPETYRRIRRDFFRNHHQTIMANDYEMPWEFPRILCESCPVVEVAQDMIRKHLDHTTHN